MADGGSESGSTRVDLSLSIGSTFLPQRQRGDLGSDLALSLMPLSPLAEEIGGSSSVMPGALVASILDAALSPSNALNTPELVPFGPLHAAEDTPALEHDSPHSPAFNSYGALRAPERRILDAPYTHSYIRIEEDSNRSSIPRDPSSPVGVLDHPSVPSSYVRIGYPPISPPSVRIPHRQNETTAPDLYSVVSVSELTTLGNGSSSRQELREFPEFRIQRLIELANTRLARNFRPPHNSGQGSDSGADALTCPERLMHNILRSRRSLDSARKSQAGADGKKPDGSDKQKEDLYEAAAAIFECNICYDLAKDPVVTPCGHLFCWPCIYQWLYGHSKHSECPVCKGQVLEINVTPIYGHGGTETTEEKKDRQDEGLGMKIPPRPHAHRIECFSEQLQRPVVQAVEGGVPHEVEGSSSNSNTGGRSPGTRLRALLMSRDEFIGANFAATDLEMEARSNSQNYSFHGLRHRSRRHMNLSALATPLLISQVPEISLRRRHGGRSRLAADQASDSSTMAVIQGGFASEDASTRSRMAGSSSTSGIRERSNSGSLDVDEEFPQTYSRRRLN